jgi:hypothetical protein
MGHMNPDISQFRNTGIMNMETPASSRSLLSERRDRLDGQREKPAPLDLSHYYSVATKRRLPSKIKQVYKFFQIPGILNIAGGWCPWTYHFITWTMNN